MTAKNPICKISDCNRIVSCKDLCNAHYLRMKKYGDPNMGEPLRGAPMAFIKKASQSKDLENCIIWPFGKSKQGYGRLSVNGKPELAHRVSLSMAIGEPMMLGMDCAHKPVICHNRACVNPNHLMWATRKENESHKVLDMTSNAGERNGFSKITEAQALEIINGPEDVEVYAARAGISVSRAKHIRKGYAWKHLHQIN